MSDEVQQQEVARIQGEAQKALDAMLAAHCAAERLVALGGHDFRLQVQTVRLHVEGLFLTASEHVGRVENHRGLRTPPVCDDPNCPIHGDPPLEVRRREASRQAIEGSPICVKRTPNPTAVGVTHTCPVHGESRFRGEGPNSTICTCKFRP